MTCGDGVLPDCPLPAGHAGVHEECPHDETEPETEPEPASVRPAFSLRRGLDWRRDPPRTGRRQVGSGWRRGTQFSDGRWAEDPNGWDQ